MCGLLFCFSPHLFLCSSEVTSLPISNQADVCSSEPDSRTQQGEQKDRQNCFPAENHTRIPPTVRNRARADPGEQQPRQPSHTSEPDTRPPTSDSGRPRSGSTAGPRDSTTSPAPQRPRHPPRPAPPPAGALGAALRTSGSRRACFRCPPSSSSRHRRDAAAVAVALLGPGAGPLGAHPPAGTARRGPPAGRARGGLPRHLGGRARRRQGHRDAPGSAPPPPLRGGGTAGGAAAVLSPGGGAGCPPWRRLRDCEGALGSAAPLGSSLLALPFLPPRFPSSLVRELQVDCWLCPELCTRIHVCTVHRKRFVTACYGYVRNRAGVFVVTHYLPCLFKWRFNNSYFFYQQLWCCVIMQNREERQMENTDFFKTGLHGERPQLNSKWAVSCG